MLQLPRFMTCPTSKLNFHSITALLQDWAKVVLWESLLHIAAFLSWTYFHFSTTFPWNHLLIFHIDTKLNLKICFRKGKQRDYPNFYPIVLQQFIFSVAGVKSYSYRLSHLFSCLLSLSLIDCEQIEGRTVSLWLVYPQHLEQCLAHGSGGLVTMSYPTVTPWTLVHQAPLSMGFPRQEY